MKGVRKKFRLVSSRIFKYANLSQMGLASHCAHASASAHNRARLFAPGFGLGSLDSQSSAFSMPAQANNCIREANKTIRFSAHDDGAFALSGFGDILVGKTGISEIRKRFLEAESGGIICAALRKRPMFLDACLRLPQMPRKFNLDIIYPFVLGFAFEKGSGSAIRAVPALQDKQNIKAKDRQWPTACGSFRQEAPVIVCRGVPANYHGENIKTVRPGGR